jgi:hypothetical protein
MDYPQLNFLFGLGLIFSLVANICVRILLSKVRPPAWLSGLSWLALALSLLAALVIEILFLKFMTPAFNLQIGLGLLALGAIGALVTARLYRSQGLVRYTYILFAAQMLLCLAGLAIAYGLYRSLVPVPEGAV